MALGFGGAAVSPNVWVAARAAASSPASATAWRSSCNVLLVQRGTTDQIRGRAFTLVISATLRALGRRDGRSAGALLD